MKYIYITILLTLITISCNKGIDILPFDIDKAQTQILQNPDSIANILEGQINAFTLSGQNKADYWFLLTKTHLQQGRSLINDSLIHFSAEYYKTNNSPHLSTAYRLAAYQINWQGNKYAEKENLLLKSLEVAKNNRDTIEIVKTYNDLAYSYFKAKEYSKAINTYERIIELSSCSRTISVSTAMIGVEYAMLGLKDSCVTYFDKAIALVKNENNQALLYDMLRSYADCLNSFGDSKKALDIINQANQLDGSFNNEYYSNFTSLNAFLNLNQLDSAKVYLDYLRNNNLAISPTDESYFYVNDVTLMFQSLYNEKKGLPLEILSMAHHGDNAMNVIWNNSSADKERIFTQNKLSKEKDKLEIEKAQQLQTYLIIIIILLFIIGVIIFTYQRKVLNKERLIQEAKERLQENTIRLYENENQIKENEDLIGDLTSQIEENNRTEEDLANIEQIVESNRVLQKQNKILNEEIDKFSELLNKKGTEKISNQNIALQEREKFLLDQLIINHDVLKKLKYSPQFVKDEQWPSIINTINVLYNNYAVRLQTEYPTLTEEDIRYCCLIELRLSISIIGTLMAVSATSVSKRKQRIKEKMTKINSKLFSEQSLENYLWNY
ncbi:tetratricopeptide repeat protein [Dysgonomonas sp. Marseille-P4677]|uniref:tetratricopeptide repeat protein n=1 Tax=Dysgonomonas sp. Marseille-P4677 TaxID=2364790 RepID=UPI001914B1CB|nr:tetratricopeptide repeat protein [Dysgonomonas sp. Marseille-P4677]MBK5720176.1 tetratricopeptide repeat protein [Dysgonomonas sp. Marseille-P4677]